MGGGGAITQIGSVPEQKIDPDVVPDPYDWQAVYPVRTFKPSLSTDPL